MGFLQQCVCTLQILLVWNGCTTLILYGIWGNEYFVPHFQVLCDFLVKKTELRKPDPDKPYPYLKDLRFVAAWESGSAPWQKQTPQAIPSTAVPVHSVPFPAPVGVPFVSAALPVVTGMAPPPSQFAGETPVWVVRDWYKDITNIMVTVGVVCYIVYQPTYN